MDIADIAAGFAKALLVKQGDLQKHDLLRCWKLAKEFRAAGKELYKLERVKKEKEDVAQA